MKSAKRTAAMVVLVLYIVATGVGPLSWIFVGDSLVSRFGVWCSLGFALLLTMLCNAGLNIWELTRLRGSLRARLS